jgi:3-dehydroquinate synthase
MAEVIKHGLIADPGLLAMIQDGDWTYNPADRKPALADLQALVSRAVEVKIQTVQEDPFDHGHRTVLNLGHSFAHAIEKSSAYSIRHGEAVAMGLIAAVNLSARLGYCPGALQDEVEIMLTDVCLPVRIPGDISPEWTFKTMWRDKKNVAGRLRLVLIRKMGDAFVHDDVPEEAVLETLKEICERTCL